MINSDKKVEIIEGREAAWQQVFRYGKFKHDKGDFDVAAKECDNMVRLVTEGVRPQKPTRMCLDYDHTATGHRPVAAGEAIRAGDVLEVKHQPGKGVWAKLLFTEKAAEAVRSGEYENISPVYHPNSTHKESGKELGPTLMAVALTNFPFIEGMETVSLPSYEAVWGKKKKSVKAAREPFGYLAYALKDGGGLMKPVYQYSQTEGVEKGMSKVLDVIRKKYDLKEEDEAKLETALSEIFAQEEKDKATAKTEREAQTKELKDLQDKVTALSESGDAKLHEQILTLQNRIGELEKADVKANAETRVEKAMSEGKILPAGKESAIAFAESHPDKFDTFVAGLQKNENLDGPKGGGGDGTPDGDPSKEMSAAATKYCSEHDGVTFAEATEKVAESNPELATRYQAWNDK